MNQLMEWALSINYLRQVADQLTEMGIDVASWLAAHDLSLADLEQADASVPWEVVRALFLEAEAITGESALGLMVGERLRINNHGMVGYAAMNSGSVRQVVELLERFIPLRINLVMVSHQVEGNYLNLQIDSRAAIRLTGYCQLNVTDVTDTRVIGDLEITSALIGPLEQTTSLRYRLDSDPPDVVEKHDVHVGTSLGLKL